jgi:hypothetical protein
LAFGFVSIKHTYDAVDEYEPGRADVVCAVNDFLYIAENFLLQENCPVLTKDRGCTVERCITTCDVVHEWCI